MISKEEVQHIAKLARLELTETEIEKMQKDMSAILDYFDLLKSASVPQEQDYGEIKKVNILREDEVISSYNIRDEIISASPDKKDDYVKVKSIL
jgi:aspartyl-tRNA(Asn)/glutamyl-tRNA(Gln) amidotransferase subunit C